MTCNQFIAILRACVNENWPCDRCEGAHKRACMKVREYGSDLYAAARVMQILDVE